MASLPFSRFKRAARTGVIAMSTTALAVSTLVVGPLSPASAAPAVILSCPDGALTKQIGTTAGGSPICQTIMLDSGTFTVPNGVTSVDVFLGGGGGGGGGGNSDSFNISSGAVLAGGGGGGGSQAIYTNVAVSGSVAVTIGAGGAAGMGAVVGAAVTPATDGGDGGTTQFGATGNYKALGGTGGKTSVITYPLKGGLGGDTPSNLAANATNGAHTGGLGIADPDTLDQYAFFTAGGGGASGYGDGTAGAATGCDASGCDMFGGNGGLTGLVYVAGSMFDTTAWGADVYDFANYGYGPGGGGAVSGLGFVDPNPAPTHTTTTGAASNMTGRWLNDEGHAALAYNWQLYTHPSIQGGTAVLTGAARPLDGVDWATLGAGGSGGVGWAQMYDNYGTPAFADISNGVSGSGGIAVIRYVAGDLGECDATNSASSTVDTNVTEVILTGWCAWHFPAGVTNVDVLTIGGGGGGSGAMWMAAGGGGAGGDVKICSQAVVDGDAIAAHVGAQGMGGTDVSYGHASSGGKSTAVFASGTTTTDLCVAEGGMPGDVPTMGDPESGWGFMGPTSGQGGYTIGGTNTGGFGSLYFVTDPDSYETGAGGGGAGYAGDGTSPICTSSACTSSAGADGVVINALSNAGTTLFSTDTREAGAGGGGGNFGAAALAVGGAHGGGAGGYGDSIDNTSNGSVAATLGSGGGGGYTGSPGEKYSSGGDGGAGAVILRYIAPPPPTTIATTTVTQVSATSISLGSTITDTATVTAAPVVTSAPAPQVAPMVAPTNPTGTVSFYYCYSATPITSCSSTANAAGASNVVTLVASGTDAATASVTWTPSQMGYYVMYAEYSGDADFDPSVDLNLAHGEEFQVTRVATHITLSCGTTCTEDSHDDHATYCSMTVGGKVTYTAKITADSGVIPTGSITFWEGGVLLGTATINSKGVATISISNLPLGLHIITAVYVGNVSLDGSVSNEMQLTVKLPASKTSLSATGLRSGNTAKKGATLKFTATVTGTKVSGSVKFYDGSTLLKTVSLSSGKATLSIATLALGEHKIKAVYAGTATLSGSESSEIVLTIQTK